MASSGHVSSSSLSDAEQRLRAEAALRQSEEKFARVFQFSPTAMAVIDLDSRHFINVNDGFERLTGFAKEELLGHSAHELGLWRWERERERILEKALRDDTIRDNPVFLRRKDQEVRTCTLSLQVAREADPVLAVAVLHDITTRLREEQLLRESEEKFAKVFRVSPDGISITEYATGRLLEVNASFERIFGYSRDVMIGKTLLELNIYRNPADRVRLLEVIARARMVRDYDIPCRNGAGRLIDILYSGERLRIGETECLVSVLRDVTEEKRVAIREKQAREDFTRQLIESQEAERNRIAGELHDSLGQDLLLIKNRTELALQQPGESSQVKSQLEKILGLAAQATAEVRRISHDLRPYQLDQLGLTRTLDAMIEQARQVAGLKVQARLEPMDDLFAPNAATNLYRVVQEALNNILRHSQAAQVRISLERDLRQVELKIEDDGIGFSSAAVEPATLGFGLRNMAERVRILGGRLVIESATGQGTRIAVTIPIAEEAAPL